MFGLFTKAAFQPEVLGYLYLFPLILHTALPLLVGIWLLKWQK